MSIAQSEFWSRLVQSGLASPAGCKRFADAFAKTCDDSAARDAKSLGNFLVRQGVLTKFQVSRLVQSEEPLLRVGSFVMTGDQPIAPFSHWIPVQTEVTEDNPIARYGFLLRVPLAGLDESIRGWLALHSEIQSESLQRIELRGGAQVDDSEQIVEIFSPLPEGGSLLKVLQTRQSLSSRKTVRIGVDLAAALQSLHTPTASGTVIAHGAIGADHVWVTPKGHAVLLRDPSCPARSPRGDLSASWIDRLESPALYAAPELADPAVLPTPAADVYSLGCLLFSLLVGRPAFTGADDRELFAAHNEALPPELIEAVEQGAAGNPLLRVLAYALAKDPEARFDSAATFADALVRAGEITERKTVSPAQPQPKERSPNASPPNASPPNDPRQGEPRPTVAAPSDPPTIEPPTVRSSTAPAGLSAASATAASQPPIISEPEPSPAEPSKTTLPSSGEAAESSAAVVPPRDNGRHAEPPPRRRRKRKRNRLPILAGMMVLPLLLLGLAIALRGRGPQERRPRPRPTPAITRNVPKVPDSRRDVVPSEPERDNGYQIVESDRLLWVPPHPADSAAPSLKMLPPGPAMIVSVPLARVVGNTDANPFVATFASDLEPLVALAEKRSGIDKQQIARCTAALFPGKNGWPEVALVIDLTEPMELKTLTDKWQAFESRLGESVIYAGESADADAFYIGGDRGKLPAGGKVERFAVGSLDRIREVAESGGGSIPFVRSMQTLWDQASAETDLVVLVTPNFLFADGRQLLAETVPEFRGPLKQWLIPNVAALTLSATVTEDALYVELRELPSGGATSASLLKSFRDSIDRWPDWADNFILNSVPDPSWRLLATRLPLMLRFVGDQTRSTIIDETVVASTYLPVDAGAQVALATFLAMNTEPGAGGMVAATTTSKPLDVDEILDRPMSISFLQLSLQFAIDATVDEFTQSLPADTTMPTVRIVGGDLEKAGITQNQQIRGFERDQVPLRKVLTDLVLEANADKTATGPDDEKQALIWVVHPRGKPPEETEILITTRDAAEGQYELPDEFRLTKP